MDDRHTKHGIRPLMVCTPGMTAKEFSELPLATEAEATPGDDLTNPFRSEEERREVESVLQMREERRRQEDRPGDAFLATIPSERPRIKQGDPTRGNDPFAFDDVSLGGIDEEFGGQFDQQDPTRGNDPFAFDDVELGAIGHAEAFDGIDEVRERDVHPIVRPLDEDLPDF